MYWSIFLTFISWCVFIFFISWEHGSLFAGISILERRAIIFTSKTMVARIFLTFSFVYIIVAVASAWSNNKRLITKLFIMAMVIIQISFVFLSGGRGATLTQVFIIGLVITYIKRDQLPSLSMKYSFNWFVAFAFGCIVIVYGYARRLASQTGTNISEEFALIVPQIARLISDTFPFADLFITAQKFALDVGYSFGLNYLALTARFIPRDFWSEKPDILGLQIREHLYGDTISGVPPTFFGEAYIAFGLIGVFFASFLLGRFSRWFDRIPAAFNTSVILVPLYIFTIFQIAFGVIKSGIENSLFHILYFYVALYVLKFLSRVNLSK